ncbi:cytochrome c-type biogenesis protein [Aliikangiella sp. IMCC44632]
MKKYAFLLLVLFASHVESSIRVFEFESAEQEQRFHYLNSILRCPTCQNQSLADSNSIVAEDLKEIVYEQVIAGKTNQEILSFMKQRYGEFILFEPELTNDNLILWGGPVVFFFIVLLSFLLWYLKNRNISND